MNLKIETVGGGVFSKFMISIQSILSNIKEGLIDIDSAKSIYIDIDRVSLRSHTANKQVIGDNNPFNYILDQKESHPFTLIKGLPKPVYTDLFNNPDITLLKKIGKQLKIHNNIIPNPNVDKNTLGIHIRLTDMNISHAHDYGWVSFDDYLSQIDIILNNHPNIKKIFVASDNDESIEKLKKYYRNIIYYNVSNRSVKENDTNVSVQYQTFLRANANSEFLWRDSFLECLTLAKCGILLKRVSNLNNTSVIFSDSITKVYNL